MQTSAQGVAFLEDEEGVVLKAYRCPAGKWTIGCGLTAASGVVTPKAGMVITREESTRLLSEALRRNYEPAVEMAMTHLHGSTVTRPAQHEFDAGVSFHFNTGAIRKASWVKKWAARMSPHDIRAALLLWSKGGGKVLPGLTARRSREAEMLLNGVYPRAIAVATPVPGPVYARWALRLTSVEIGEVQAAFKKLGYDPGPMRDAILASSVRQFQRDHNLNDDAVIGRATLSTLQRRLDAVSAAAKPAAVAAPAAAMTATDAGPAFSDGLGVTGADWIILCLVALWGLHTAWRYRDVIAAKIAPATPRIATFLRSF